MGLAGGRLSQSLPRVVYGFCTRASPRGVCRPNRPPAWGKSAPQKGEGSPPPAAKPRPSPQLPGSQGPQAACLLSSSSPREELPRDGPA